MMEVEALEAEKSGRMRAVVQDNGPIHRRYEVQKLWLKWGSMGLYIFFLPKCCFQRNAIKLEWLYLKKDKLCGQTFEDELDLAYAVIGGVEGRGERGNYNTHRVKFNSSSTP